MKQLIALLLFSDVLFALAAPGAKVEVALDPAGAPECAVAERAENGERIVTVGKKGRDYPAILSIALVR